MAVVNIYGSATSTSSAEGEIDVLDERCVETLQALAPPGIAWPRDADSNFRKLLRALSYEYARVKRRALELLEEVDPRTTYELLEDWERVYGLPDGCSDPTTIEGRRAALLAKMNGFGDPNEAFFINIAERLGYTSTIETFSYLDMFDCTSECDDYLYNGEWKFLWTMRQLGGDSDLELDCTIQSLVPLHTKAIMRFEQSWVSRTSNTVTSLGAVAYNGFSLWVAVGSSGCVITSPDAITAWTVQTSGTANQLKGIAYGNATWVAVGVNNGTVITSPDGVTWTTRTSGFAGGSFNSLVWTGSLFVAVGTGGGIYTSPDGITWTSRTSGTANQLWSVCWSGSLLVAVGDSGTVVTSPDGITWTVRTSVIATTLFGVAWNGEIFAATGSSSKVMSSTDGITWTLRQSFDTSGMNGIVATDGKSFVGLGASTTNIVSWDGLNWEPDTKPTSTQWTGGAYADGRYVVVGQSGVIYTSEY